MNAVAGNSFASVAAAVALGDWARARTELRRVQQTSGPDLAMQVQAWSYRIAPFWWTPLQGGGVALRRCRADDADFFSSCFSDREFSTQYNRQQPWTGDLAKALTKVGTLSPVDLKALHWIVTDKSDHAIGLASLTSLNLANRKAEFSIGFPSLGATRSTKAFSPATMVTLLAFHFAFFVARLNKLTAYIYRGNDGALRNAQHIGFQIEGLLKDHFYLPPGEFVDVHVLGLTRAQLQANPAILRMARRRLGLDWTLARTVK